MNFFANKHQHDQKKKRIRTFRYKISEKFILNNKCFSFFLFSLKLLNFVFFFQSWGSWVMAHEAYTKEISLTMDNTRRT